MLDSIPGLATRCIGAGEIDAPHGSPHATAAFRFSASAALDGATAALEQAG